MQNIVPAARLRASASVPGSSTAIDLKISVSAIQAEGVDGPIDKLLATVSAGLAESQKYSKLQSAGPKLAFVKAHRLF